MMYAKIDLATNEIAGTIHQLPPHLAGFSVEQLTKGGVEIGVPGFAYWPITEERPNYQEGIYHLTGPSESVDVEQKTVTHTYAVEAVADLTPLRNALKAYAANKRWQKEIGGIEFGGMPIPTDERTQNVITAAYASATLDPQFSIPSWKVAPGVYVPLDNATIIALAQAVRSHVQSCFTLNGQVDAEIDAGNILSAADVDEAFAAA